MVWLLLNSQARRSCPGLAQPWDRQHSWQTETEMTTPRQFTTLWWLYAFKSKRVAQGSFAFANIEIHKTPANRKYLLLLKLLWSLQFFPKKTVSDPQLKFATRRQVAKIIKKHFLQIARIVFFKIIKLKILKIAICKTISKTVLFDAIIFIWVLTLICKICNFDDRFLNF